MSEQIYAHSWPAFSRYVGADVSTLSSRFQEICQSRSMHIISPISGDMSERCKHIIGLISRDMPGQIYAHYRPDFRTYVGADICTLSAGCQQIYRSRCKHTTSPISGDMSEQIYAYYRPDFRRYVGADVNTLSARFQEICRSRSKHIIGPISGDMSEQM